MNKKIKEKNISKKILSLLLISLFFLSGCIKEDKIKNENDYYEELPNNYLFNDYINTTDDDKTLIKNIRDALIKNSSIQIEGNNFSFVFNNTYSWVFITIYQEKQDWIRSYALNDTLEKTVNDCIKQLIQNKNFKNFLIQDVSVSRLQFEIITTPGTLVYTDQMSSSNLNDNYRWEIGVDGLMAINETDKKFSCPTDAYVENMLYIYDVVDEFEEEFGSENFTFLKFHTRSFITFENEVIPLYRGYPLQEEYTYKDCEAAIFNGLDWLVNHQIDDGRFIYYVDSITGSTQDHIHPNSDYYNMLRHCGALLFLLKAYEETGNETYLSSAEKGVDFIINNLQVRVIDSYKNGMYPFYNKKAKLGGAGLALCVFCKYAAINESVYYYAEGITRHILEEIQEDGEFNYYYIYPSPGSNLFSFYYPGEALLALAEFYKICKDETLKTNILTKAEKAIDFLIYERPIKYAGHFKSLPSDSWLMSAILEWSDAPQLDKEDYKNFVYEDAEAMVTHQYNFTNALYPDYLGGFYYNYGDHVYCDGARSEGLMSAYELAKKEGKNELAKRLLNSLELAALSQLRLVNTNISNYPYSNVSIAHGGIRFKLTRQWFRIDTIQHVGTFYLRLLKEIGYL